MKEKSKTLLEVLHRAVVLKAKQVPNSTRNHHTGMPEAGRRNPTGAKMLRRMYKRHTGLKSADAHLDAAERWYSGLK